MQLKVLFIDGGSDYDENLVTFVLLEIAKSSGKSFRKTQKYAQSPSRLSVSLSKVCVDQILSFFLSSKFTLPGLPFGLRISRVCPIDEQNQQCWRLWLGTRMPLQLFLLKTGRVIAMTSRPHALLWAAKRWWSSMKWGWTISFAMLQLKWGMAMCSTFIEQFWVHAASILGNCGWSVWKNWLVCHWIPSARTLFTTPLQNTGGRTFVVGVPSAIFEQIIRYAYLRDVTAINDSNVREILITADYFGIVGLLKYCIEFIITTMTTENCVIMWLMSR